MTVQVGETVRPAEPEGALARPVLRRILAAVVVAAWVAWAVPSWMSSLHEVRPHEFIADVESGRISGYQVVTTVRSEPFSLATQWMADVPAADEQGRPVDGPPRQVVYMLEGETRTRWSPEVAFSVGERDVLTALIESGARPFTPETQPPSRDWAAYPALVAAGLALVGLVLLPPTLGTRPFWVLSATLGMGLGVVAYAVTELWWRGSPSAAEGARLRWWHGVIVAFVGGLVVAVLRAAIT
ncbi:hypothetical protein LL946_09760 [Knoellia locipacati]|uniref:hypothetical protein n=1 Tax=Knoellia locipacati TaxID=882824 RepID=UPI00384F4C0A